MIVISPEIFGLQRVGGISKYFAELHLALRKTGSDARIYAAHHINSYLDSGSSIYGRFKNAPRLRRIQRHINELQFHLWCARNGSSLVIHRSFYGARYRPRCNRLVTTIHDLIPEMFPDQSRGSEHLSILKRRSCDQADAICVNSETTARDLQSMWGTPREKIWVTPLGVRPIDSSSRSWCTEVGDYLMQVGPRSGYKNGRALFHAFARADLPQHVKLVCFGGGVFDPGEIGLLEQLGIRNQVIHCTGSDADLAGCYRAALGFICPSRYEGFGLPVLEAMAYGCPVACSRAGALPEVGGAYVRYFDPDSIDSMAHALSLLSDDRLTAGQRLAAAQRRSELFTWSKTAERTKRAYLGVGVDLAQEQK